MIENLVMVSTSSITVQRLVKVVLCAPAVGAKIQCLFLAVFKFTVAKNHHFCPQRRPAAPIHVKFATAEGHEDPLAPAKFHANRNTGVDTRPQNRKF